MRWLRSPRAKEKGVARLALKALAFTPLANKKERAYPKCWYRPIDHLGLAQKALRFTLSEDVTAAIPPGENKIYQMALELATGHRPMKPEEREEFLASTEGLAPLFKA